jgi:hypothetical protein
MVFMLKNKTTAQLIIMLILMLSFAVVATGAEGGAQDSNATGSDPGQEPKWYDKLDFSGDLRLRYDGIIWENYYDDGRRDRFRFRLRFGVESDLLDNLKVGFQLRSGNPNNPISDNQSFDDSLNKFKISIAQAYLDWSPIKPLSIIVGKFSPKNLWTVSDMQYDDDVVTEGAMELFTWKPGGSVKELDLNLYQFILNESGSSADSYMFGGQVVPVFSLGKTNELAVGAGFEAITNPHKVADLYFSKDITIDTGYVGNFVDPVTRKIISKFQVGDLFFQWKNTAFTNWSIKLNVYLYKNFGASSEMGAILPVGDGGEVLAYGRGTDNDTAWFGRIQVGDYKKPGQVAIRFSRYDSKPDAIFFAYGQSDARRSSNVDGYRTDFRIGLPKSSYINFTWYNTNWTLGDDTTMNRLLLDFIFPF